MPKTIFGDEAQTTAFGDPVIAAAPQPASKKPAPVAPAEPLSPGVQAFFDRQDAWNKEQEQRKYLESLPTISAAQPDPGPQVPPWAREVAAMPFDVAPGPVTFVATVPEVGPGAFPLAGAAAAAGHAIAQKIRGVPEPKTVKEWTEPALYGGVQAVGFALPVGIGRASKPAEILMQPRQAFAKELAVGAGAGAVAGYGIDATYQAATTGKVDWNQANQAALTMALFGALGRIPTALEMMNVAPAERQALFEYAQAHGYKGNSLQELLTDLEGIELSAHGRQQNARPVSPVTPAAPTGQPLALPEAPAGGVPTVVRPAVSPPAPVIAPPTTGAPGVVTPAPVVAAPAPAPVAPPVVAPVPVAPAPVSTPIENANPIPSLVSPVRSDAAVAPVTPQVAAGIPGEMQPPQEAPQANITSLPSVAPAVQLPQPQSPLAPTEVELAGAANSAGPKQEAPAVPAPSAPPEPPPPAFIEGQPVVVHGEGDFARDGIVTGSGPTNNGVRSYFVRTNLAELAYPEHRIEAKSVEPTVEDLLRVPEPDVSVAQHNMDAVREQWNALKKDGKALGAGLAALRPKVIRTTGPRYERGRVKKSAPAKLVAQYHELERKLAAVNERASQIQAATKQDRTILNLAAMRRIINDPKQPLIRRLYQRKYLHLDEEGGKPVPESLGQAISRQTSLELQKRFPDITPAEMALVDTAFQRAVSGASTPAELDRAFELDPELNLYRLRDIALANNLAAAHFTQWQYEAPEFAQVVANARKTGRLSAADVEQLTQRALAEEAHVKQQRIAQADIERELYQQKEVASGITKVISDRGITIEPHAPLERRVSVLANRKQLIAQREFLQTALRDLIKEAPDRNSIHPDMMDDYKRLEKARNDWNAGNDITAVRKTIREMAVKMLGGPKVEALEATRPRWGDVATSLLKGIEGRLPAGTPGQIIIEVPGDGTYRLQNWRPTLERFAEAIRGFGYNLGPPEPSTPPVRGHGVAKLGAPKSSVEVNKVLESFTGDSGPTTQLLQDGTWTIATDNHVLVASREGAGKTREEIQARAGSNYPNYTTLLTKAGIHLFDGNGAPIITVDGEARRVATDEFAKKLSAGIAALDLNQKRDWVQIHFTRDGGVGVSSTGSIDYRSDNVQPGEASRGVVDPFILRDVIEAMRQLGAAEVEVIASSLGDSSAFVVKVGSRHVALVAGIGAKAKAPAPTMEDREQPPASKVPKAPAGAAASPGRPTVPSSGDIPPEPVTPADDPDFSQLPIQLPEMVQFYRQLSGGKNPHIVTKIRALHGTALGVFRYKEGNLDSGVIELRADLFQLLSQEEKNQLLAKAVAWAKLMKEANPDLDLRAAIGMKFHELVKEAEAEAMKKDPTRALAVFAHEIGHFVDFLPDATLRRGNLFGRMATLKRFMAHFIGATPDNTNLPPTASERAKLRAQAEKELEAEVKTIVETIRREEPIYETIPITPDQITGILKNIGREEFPEFYDWFVGLGRAEKADVLRKAMRGIIDERAAQFATRRQIGTKVVEETIERKVGELTPEAIRARYEELLRQELKARGLISLTDIKRELSSVIAWWHHTEKIPPYFTTSVEMYAETFSILMNNPAALAKRAPTWWNALQAYLVRKPEVKALYDKIQGDIKSGAIYTQRVNNLRGSWATDEANTLERELAAEKIPWRRFKDGANLLFNKQQGPIQRLARKHLGQPEADKLMGALKDYLYRQTAVEGFARQVNIRVERVLAQNNLTHDDLSEFMFHNRIVNGDAVETANAQGWSPNTSTQRLKEMQSMLGTKRHGALLQAAAEMRTIYEQGPIRVLRESGALTPELMEKIEKNIAYSPFNKAPDAFNPMEEGTIHGMLEHQYGKEVTARIYHRMGTFADIKSPYVSLLLKGDALMKFAYQQNAAKSMRDYLMKFEPDIITPADMEFNGHRLVPKYVQTAQVGTLYTLDAGVLHGYYVPRAIWETMQHASGIEQMIVGAALRVLSPFKAILTELNPGFWMVNFPRDLLGMGVQLKGGMGALWRAANDTAPMPGIGGKLGVQVPRAYIAARATLTSQPNPIADQLLSRMMVISRADPRGEHLGHPDEIDRWLLRASKHPEVWGDEVKHIGTLLRLWEIWKRQGQVYERAVKAMGMAEIDRRYGASAPDENTPWVTMPEWMKKKLVNELVGSPDFNERGRGIAVVEVVGGPIFANAWLRGVESFYRAQSKNGPWGASGKNVWTKFILFFGLPVAAFYAYEQGWLDFGMDATKADDEREMLKSIPERDKLRGFIKTIGWVDKAQKKVAYVVLPFPEQVRQLAAGMRKLLQSINGDPGRSQGMGSVIQYGAQDLPGQNPLIREIGNWWQFAAEGRNPYDPFRGRPLLDDKVFQAGGGAKELAQQSLSNISGNIIPRPINQQPGDKPPRVEQMLHGKLLTEAATGHTLVNALFGPVVANTVGRWVRISNLGIAERDRAIMAPVGQHRAELQLVGDELVRKHFDGEAPTQSEIQLFNAEPYIGEYMNERAKAYVGGAQGPQLRDFMRANNAERAALMEAWAKEAQARRDRLNGGAGTQPASAPPQGQDRPLPPVRFRVPQPTR